MRKRLILLCGFAVFNLMLTGCDKSTPSVSPATSRVPASTYFEVRVGDQNVRMKLAISEAEQQRGLMQVAEMGENDGMIFIKASPERASFWMKNTLIALDIGFFDASGTLLEVRRMWPQEERITSSASEAVKYSLEMNHNWFSSKGLKPGARIDLAALREAVKRRGADPADLGM